MFCKNQIRFLLFLSQFIFNTMLQQEDYTVKIKIEQVQEIGFLSTSKQNKPFKEGQLDFEKNYPKNIFIPMIQYLAEIGLKHQYQISVGSRQQFQGKNVVSLSLIHKLMGACWFKQNVQVRVLISTICNKILMNSKIKKKLFHLFIVKNLFQVYDQDLKEFKKRISKLANSISQLTYVEDELFEFPSSILYLLRLFYKLISTSSSFSQQQFISSNPINANTQSKTQELNINILSKTFSQSFQHECHSSQNINPSKQGSKEQYKHYIRNIINHLNNQGHKKDLVDFKHVQGSILRRQKQIIQKYGLPPDVPGWCVFIEKVVLRCFECYKKNGKLTHAIMNDWISDFRQCISTVQKQRLSQDQRFEKNLKKEGSSVFKPLILQYLPNKL